ncbi:MAG TPA: hypothetical protein VHD85_04825 [Terracidiphilus sp.]|nr:hypothetical protein [Terracidiphilus sp.]
MPQYYLDRYFVPDDKDIYDMLKACGTSHDKLWMFARGYGILFSSTEPRELMIDALSRLPVDRRKLQEIFLLNSSKDRDEKYSTKSVASSATLDRVTAVINTVRDTRAVAQREEYRFEQPSPGVINIKVGYKEADYSRAEPIQTRDKEVTIQVIQSDGKLKIRHHSNSKAEELVRDIIAKLESVTETKAPISKLDFSGIKDPKIRTRFFQELSQKLAGYIRQDVPTLKVYRLNREATESEDEEDEKMVVAEVKRMFMSGIDVTQSPEYLELEKRGFFISAISWISEHQTDPREHYEFSAEFTNPEDPLDIKYGCLGKYARSDDGTLKKNRATLSAIERDALLGLLDTTAFTIYDGIIGELKKAAPSNGNPSPVVPQLAP